jgi:hypothetical protein
MHEGAIELLVGECNRNIFKQWGFILSALNPRGLLTNSPTIFGNLTDA